MADDPFIQVFRGIWAMLEASEEFCSLVPEGCRIKFADGTRDPDIDERISADTARVAVLSLGPQPSPEYTSDSSGVSLLWSIELVSGSQQLETVCQLDWIIYRALLKWRAYLRERVLWNEKACVQLFRALKVDADIATKRELRAPKGWQSLWVGKCDLNFGTANLRE